MKNTPRKSRRNYQPLDRDRAAVACAYDRSYQTNVQDDTDALCPADYDVNGALVTLRNGGTTYWVVTLAEARSIGISPDTCERFQSLGRAWLITPA